MTDRISDIENRQRRTYTRREAHYGIPADHEGDTGSPNYLRSELLRFDLRFGRRMEAAGYSRIPDRE